MTSKFALRSLWVPVMAAACGLGGAVDAQTVRAVETTTVSGYCPTGCLARGAARPGAPGNPTVPQQGLSFRETLVAGNPLLARPPTGNTFRFSYNATTDTLSYFVQNGLTQTITNAQLAAGRTLLVLARGTTGTPATLSNLSFNGQALDGLAAGLGGFTSAGTFEYLSFSNFGAGQSWNLDGTLMVAGGSGQAPRVEFILTDLGPGRQLADGSEMLYVFGSPLVTTGSALAGDATIFSRIEFEQAADSLYAGSLFGSGSVTKSGPATLELSGDSASFAGRTVVAEGTLSLTGVLGGRIGVGPGGTLAGTGTAPGAVTVVADGTLAPGPGIGTLSLGSLDMAGDYRVDYRPPAAGAPLVPIEAGQSLRGRNTLLDPGLAFADQDADLIVVSGAAQIRPGARVVLAPQGTPEDFEAALGAPGNTNRQLRYQILRADAGIAGRFVALTNAAATLEYLDAGGGAQDVWLVLETPGVPPIVIVPSAPVPYSLPFGIERPRCDVGSGGQRYCAVVQGSIVDFSSDDEGPSPGATTEGGLGLIGLAYRFDNDLLVGVAYSSAEADISIADGSGSGDFSRRGGLLWAEWQQGPLDLRGWLGVYDDGLDARRETALGGSASADVSASETAFAVEARHWMTLRPGLEISPLLGVEAAWIDQDPYTETGAGAESFSADATSRQSLRSLVGVDLRSAGTLADRPVEWQAALGWAYELGDTSTTISGTYAGDPTQTTVSGTGPDLARSSLGLTLGATVAVTDDAALRLAYTAANAEDWLNQALTLRLSMRF